MLMYIVFVAFCSCHKYDILNILRFFIIYLEVDNNSSLVTIVELN